MAILLAKSYEEVGHNPIDEVETALQESMVVQESIIRSRFDSNCVDEAAVKQYKGQYLEKFNKVFGSKVAIGDIRLERELQAYYSMQPASKLSNKDDLVEVINRALGILGIAMTVDESVAYTLAQNSTLATMYPQWKDMVSFLER